MNPYTVECGDCGPVESGLGFEAAFAHALEHAMDNGDHTCQITADGQIVVEGDLAEGDR